MEPRAFTVMPLTRSMDTSNLEDFGQVISLLNQGPRIFNPDASIDEIYQALETTDYNPAVDVIVQSGPSVALIFLTLAVVKYVSENFEDQTYLSVIYDGRTKRYQRCAIPLPVLIES